MTTDHKQFEDQLRRDLCRLAEAAPPGPEGQAVGRALRRRTIRRRSLAGAAVVALVAVSAMLLSPGDPGPSRAPVAEGPQQLRPLVAAAPYPRPLAPDAPRSEIESAIRGYFRSIDFHGKFIVEKSPGEDLAYAFSGTAAAPLDKLLADLEELLRNYQTVSIDLSNGDMQYTLLSLGRSSANL